MLSRFTHENLMPLVGFCDEGGQKILVYEHAYHKSLDLHLSSRDLKWIQRIKICLQAARGLSYLHDDHGDRQRVLHRDIKSSNILLDDNWKAKLSDMGLSKIGPSNQLHSAIVTQAVGTPAYIDPLYMETNILSKESDVYSFGVVLLEVLCGKLCYENYTGQFKNLVHSWKESYKQNNLAGIIFQDIAQQIDPDCLETFSGIAFQCVQKSRDKRPTMSDVVERLETALDIQENGVGIEKETFEYYKQIARSVLPPLEYRSKRQLRQLLSKGVLLNGGKTRFSLDKNGKHCEMIFIQEPVKKFRGEDAILSLYYKCGLNIDVHVRAQFLSPQTTYTVNFVFKAGGSIPKDIQRFLATIKYRLAGETKLLIPHLAGRREDGRMMVELYQFTGDRRTFDFNLEFFLGLSHRSEMAVEGFEFRPLEKAEQEAVLEHEKVDTRYLSDSDPYWEQILPNDYPGLTRLSKNPIRWTTKEELYHELIKGFVMNNGQEWFFLNKNGKKCFMVSAINACDTELKVVEKSLSWEPRFGKAARVHVSGYSLSIKSLIRSQVLSPETTYGTYLVYQLPEDHSSCFEVPLRVRHGNKKYDQYEYEDEDEDEDKVEDEYEDKVEDEYEDEVETGWYIYLLTPRVPVIRPKADENTHNPINNPKLLKCFPRQRSDGWMEVQIWEFETITPPEMVRIDLELYPISSIDYTLEQLGLDPMLVLGIELRPI